MTPPAPGGSGPAKRSARPPRSAPKPDPARLLAWRVLRAVDTDGAYANLLLPDLLRESRLDERDRGLVTELTYGTLRATGTLDHVLGFCSSRPVAEIDSPLRDALRLGAYQLLRTRIPSHAAVAATVELVRGVIGEGPGSFANAVLRRVAERAGDLGAPAYADDAVGHLAVTTAHPAWIVEEFAAALDGDLEQAAAALRADDERPEVHLVARPGRIARDELLADAQAAGLVAAPGPWTPWSARLAGGDPAALSAVRDGRAAVQDEGSQLAVSLVAALLPDRPARALDVCAGPGGKSALLAALLAQRGGDTLVAAELHEHRARLTARALAAGAGSTESAPAWVVVTADARTAPWAPGTFDVVLLDAPCTGLGALRRRPEARWRRQPSDVLTLAALQQELLAVAIQAVRPGGHLVYVVCSPVVREGPDQMAVLAAHHQHSLETIDVRELLPGVRPLGDGPAVQLWPHLHGTDAMFLAAARVATLPPYPSGSGVQ
ncbi:MAG TPA: transcription antitermination factor NusB [Mycobacteriales bacterium]|nr:transcription antitermination factor NusB [Mycobacteriales bacterium]